ncbi:MAG: DUF3267 domain-containing protein [Bacteroidales bacterium]|nr:DUF3267 domain-containing protein [Bacteroidales bacterium]
MNEHVPNHINSDLPSGEFVFEDNKTMLFIVVVAIVFAICAELLFDTIWKGRPALLHMEVPSWVKYTSVLLAIVMHELIHGLFFALHAENGFKAVSFGFSRTMFSPYCHCKDPVRVKHYRRAGIAPTLILGIIPLAFALITGVNWIKTLGILLTIGGLGDVLVWLKMFRFNNNLMVRDHPEKMGFIIDK